MGSTKNLFREGQKIGDYTLIRKLGEGSFGVVWLAEDQSKPMISQLAIKLPLKADIKIDEFQKEADTWKMAESHPNILRFLNAGAHKNFFYIASEYANGGSLHGWLKSNGGDVKQLESYKEMIKGILNGLQHLHARNIIHRDLNPKNVLLRDKNPLIADFGLARFLLASNSTQKIAGTPRYMSPEAINSDRCIESDLWAVGIIFYEMITGHVPFKDIPSILSNKPPKLPQGLSSELEYFIGKALDKDKEQRFNSAEKMLIGLDTISAAKPKKPSTIKPFKKFKDIGPFGKFKDLDEPWIPELVAIPSGSFQMGAPDNDKDAYDDERPQHEVIISKAFAIGRTVVTIAQFAKFCEQTGRDSPSFDGCTDDCPVFDICWIEALTYIEWLSRVTGIQYRLPSEAEWEYCCRAGTTTVFNHGSEISGKHVNLEKITNPHPVEKFSANRWGLYGMHGNVWEFVADVWHENYNHSPRDGSYSIYGKNSKERVVRGGSYSSPRKELRSSVRCYLEVLVADKLHGFRVARSL